MNKDLLVIDDEEIQADIIADILQKEGYTVDKTYSAEEGLKLSRKKEYSAMLVDQKMPGIGGLGLLNAAVEEGIRARIIIMTAYGTIENAVAAMKRGAFDYITKPFNKDELLINVNRAVDAYNLLSQNVMMKEELSQIYDDHTFIGESREASTIRDLIDKVAASDTGTVLITGESGTGKELVARQIHARSGRRDMPFVPVNCSAIPRNLLESELFGYVRGAFTDAVSSRDGKFKKANGGMLFLDEIADMPFDMQAKLLRVIQDGEVTPIGGDDAVTVDVRIICATNRDVENMVRTGRFREDLFYRLNVIPIYIPPLRERREDIPLLVRSITEDLNVRLKKKIDSVQPEVLDLLTAYDFPGNVRELENILERAFILAGDGPVSIEHFSFIAERDETIDINEGTTLRELSKKARDRAEKQAIESALNKTNWNRVKAARMLEIDYKTLRNKINELNISPKYREGGGSS